jgi:sugar phosphate isomerase/epimerase
MNVSRRHFLWSAGAAALSVSSLRFALATSAQEPHFQFPTQPVERLALTSWPFRAFMKSPKNPNGMDVLGFARMAIEKFNIRNINPISVHFQSLDLHDLEKLRKNVHQAGSRFVGLGLQRAGFYDPDPAVRREAVESAKRWIDIAVILGSPSVRQGLSFAVNVKPSADSSVDRAAGSLGELADYGAKKNVVINLENDNFVSENPFVIVRIIEKASHPYLRALPDIGNSLPEGGSSGYNARALRAMYPHAFNMSHVKDELWQGGKFYKIDLAQAFGIARDSGYKGFFSMEVDVNSRTPDPFAGTQRLIRETLHYIS